MARDEELEQLSKIAGEALVKNVHMHNLLAEFVDIPWQTWGGFKNEQTMCKYCDLQYDKDSHRYIHQPTCLWVRAKGYIDGD
jgi:hypothetical protein